MSCLSIDITEQQHHVFKSLAALEGESIKADAIERLFPADEQIALQELRAPLQSRFTNAVQTGHSALSTSEIAG